MDRAMDVTTEIELLINNHRALHQAYLELGRTALWLAREGKLAGTAYGSAEERELASYWLRDALKQRFALMTGRVEGDAEQHVLMGALVRHGLRQVDFMALALALLDTLTAQGEASSGATGE